MQRHSRIEVARLLPPGSVSVDLVSQEPHISVATLERWRAAASEAPRKADKGWLWTFVPGAKEGGLDSTFKCNTPSSYEVLPWNRPEPTLI